MFKHANFGSQTLSLNTFEKKKRRVEISSPNKKDELLCKQWSITKEEWKFIDSKIKTVGETANTDTSE